MADKLQEFINLAKSKVNQDRSWTGEVTGYTSGPWCAAFVWACTKTAGIQDVIIHGCSSASNTVYYSTERNYGVWLPGPVQGKYPMPQAGDLFTLDGVSPGNIPYTYGSSHIGIVVSSGTSTFVSVEGNVTNKSAGDYRSLVRSFTYSINSKNIKGFFRPNWSVVGSNYINTDSTVVAPIYSGKFNPIDALLREVGYMNDKCEPSISPTDVKLSVVNYTQGLSDLIGQLPSDGSSSVVDGGGSVTTTADLSKLNTIQQEIIRFFCSKGCQVSAGLAVCANVEYECSYKIGLRVWDVNAYSGGMCMWHADRLTKMVNYVGSDWRTNLTGQLSFLWYELQNVNMFSKVRDALVSAANTLADAKHAAGVFVRKFEVPANIDSQSMKRQAAVERMWNQIYGG